MVRLHLMCIKLRHMEMLFLMLLKYRWRVVIMIMKMRSIVLLFTI